jgi:hypothetical protein
VISGLRSQFNERFTAAEYTELLAVLEHRCGGAIQFRVAETPIFIEKARLEEMAEQGSAITRFLMSDAAYLNAAKDAIPIGYDVPAQTSHPHFLTADFALIRTTAGDLVPRLVEIQAFPSVFAYQAELCRSYREVFGLASTLGIFLGGLDEQSYWELLGRTVLADYDPQNVVLTEIDPLNQKTYPDFHLTAHRLGIQIVDITAVEPVGKRLHYRNRLGQLVPIYRIYNRAIADELIARNIKPSFDLSRPWEVEWAGHPNWYFLISKYSLPYLSRSERFPVVPPTRFLNEFLAGPGEESLARSGVSIPRSRDGQTVYSDLLLKPLFSFAGKGIEFEPSRARLEAVPLEERAGYVVQQRMPFEATINTPFGPTQAEIRILYMWPDGGSLTPALSLVRLGRGKMMGVDHNKNQEWVGGSAAFYI